MLIDVTANAWQKVKEILDGQPDLVFRLAVHPGGCNGFRKEFSLGLRELDDLVTSYNDYIVAIDPESYDLIGQATLDYVESNNGNYFDLIVSSASSTCGCGDSFSI